MLISRNILSNLLESSLPETETVARELTMHAFEVEGVKQTADDEILDIDVLPNRAHDCLSHLGIAGEVARIFDIPRSKGFEQVELDQTLPDSVGINIEEGTASRFIIAVVEGVEKGESPSWLVRTLESFGERSVSPVVDILNYVMFLTGQPLHAYDLDAVERHEGENSFTVREAKKGEEFTPLDDEKIELVGGELVIAGQKNVLGLAGVKGGSQTAVSENTKRIALEAAMFSPVRVRRTAQSTKIKTNASKRFENGVSAELAPLGIREALRLLGEVFEHMKVTTLKDEYPDKSALPTIQLDAKLPSELLGIDISHTVIEKLLQKVGCQVTKEASMFMVTPPFERLDLTSPVDLVEEIGRLYGYVHIEPQELPDHTRGEDRSSLKTELAIKRLLSSRGYSEVITQAFRESGDIEVSNPLANQLPFLRTELVTSTHELLKVNVRNAELIGKETIRVFEMGTVFPQKAERKSIVFGAATAKGSKEAPGEEAFKEETETLLAEALDISKDEVRDTRLASSNEESSLVLEYNLTQLLEKVAPESDIKLENNTEPFTTFSEFSSFPFVLRDIAIWTPNGTAPEDVELIIRESAGDLLQRIRLFDRFEKTSEDDIKRISYAFRLVFQSFERTLSDDEVNDYMTAIESALSKERGFEIR